MKNKFIMMLIFIFTLVLGTSCFAMTVDEVEYYLNYIKDNMNTTNTSYTPYINFMNSNKYNYLINSINDNDIENYNLMSVYYIQNNSFNIQFYQLSNDTYAKFFQESNTHYIWLFNENSSYNYKADWVNRRTYSIYLYNNSSNIPEISVDLNPSLFEKSSYIHILGIFPKIDIYNLSNNVATDIEIYNWVNSGTYPAELISYTYTPAPATPTISVNSSAYNEYAPINVTINCNDYYEATSNGVPLINDYYYLRLDKINSNNEIIYSKQFHQDFSNFYNNGNVFSVENYDDETDSFSFDLLNYHMFDLSADDRYVLSLVDYDNNIISNTGYFTVHFSDDYTVNEEGKYNITPVIRINPSEASTSKTVTISSPVQNSTIYYKTSIDNTWHMYTEPFVINQNCTVYAHCYDIDGAASALSSYSISNITNSEVFANRPTMTPDVWFTVLSENGRKHVTFKVFALSDLIVEWSSDKVTWSIFTPNMPTSGPYERYEFYESVFPKNFYFRYKDSDSGLFGPTLTISLSGKDTSLIGEHYESSYSDAYDENGNYLPDNNSSSDFNDAFWHDLFGEDTPSPNNVWDTLKLTSKVLEGSWNFIKEFPTFFIMFRGLFIFIPNSILALVFAFLIFKFILALIGFLRG